MSAKRILIFFLVISLLGLLSVYYPKLTGEATKTQAQEYPKEQAILERVIDGDTIEALVNNETWKIRLLGINTPEKKMPFSNESKAFLQQFVGKKITLERDWEDTDKYKRKLRYIYFDNRFLNQEILELGLANSYYTSGLKYEQQFLNAENQAKNLQIGIWTKSKEVCSDCIKLKELNPIQEYFILINECSYDCDMIRWFAKDAGRNTFYLSAIVSGQESIYSSNGKDVWNNDGDRFFMFDDRGLLVLFYQY